MPIITKNKKALHNYEILEKLEAGIVLTGQEVKSTKQGHIRLQGSHVRIQNGEAWLHHAHISKYRHAGNLPDYDPERERKLLLHKKELKYLIGKTKEKGLTITPISVYTKRNKIKVEIAVARGRKTKDKREVIKKREIKRKIHRALRKK